MRELGQKSGHNVSNFTLCGKRQKYLVICNPENYRHIKESGVLQSIYNRGSECLVRRKCHQYTRG